MERDPKGPEKDVSSKTGESAVNDYQFSFTQILTSNERTRRPANGHGETGQSTPVSVPHESTLDIHVVNPYFRFSDTTSLTSSVQAYVVENGRTYDRDGVYYLPNDQEEIDRLNLMHEVTRRAIGKFTHIAPWTQTHYPRRVLDVATGTGRWCFDFAEAFPQTELIIGIDLSPIQPREVPPNVAFVVDDATQPWLDDDLDYVHVQCTNGCWADMYTDIVQQAFAKLNPGGWLECVEPDPTVRCDDGTMAPDHGLKLWVEELIKMGLLADRHIVVGPLLKAWLEQAGFVDVQERVVKVPICAWPQSREQKEMGWWMEEIYAGNLAGMSRAFSSRLKGLTPEEHELSLIPARRDARDRSAHTYNNMYIVVGRKPGVKRPASNVATDDD